jgi:hypothetical protein
MKYEKKDGHAAAAIKTWGTSLIKITFIVWA